MACQIGGKNRSGKVFVRLTDQWTAEHGPVSGLEYSGNKDLRDDGPDSDGYEIDYSEKHGAYYSRDDEAVEYSAGAECPPDLDEEFANANSRRFAHSAWSRYLGIVKQANGKTIKPEAKAKSDARRARKTGMSHTLARRLTEGGVNGYSGQKMHAVSLAGAVFGTHDHREIPGFVNNTIIPDIAAAKRAQILADLEHYIARHGKKCRSWNFTLDSRKTTKEIRESSQFMQRKISELNAEPWLKSTGIRLVFRATEFGTLTSSAKVASKPDSRGRWEVRCKHPGEYVERYYPTKEAASEGARNLVKRWKRDPEKYFKKNADGNWTWNVHSHCVVIKPEYLKDAKWSALLVRIQHWWHGSTGGGFYDSGYVKDAREVCKYFSKPADLLLLDASELVTLYNEKFKLRMVEALGPLREERGTRKRAFRRLVRVNGRLSEEKAHNRRPGRRERTPGKLIAERIEIEERKLYTPGERRSPERKASDREKATKAALAWIRANGQDRLIDATNELNSIQNAAQNRLDGLQTPPENQIVAFTLPAPAFSERIEPTVIVRGYNPDTIAVSLHESKKALSLLKTLGIKLPPVGRPCAAGRKAHKPAVTVPARPPETHPDPPPLLFGGQNPDKSEAICSNSPLFG